MQARFLAQPNRTSETEARSKNRFPPARTHRRPSDRPSHHSADGHAVPHRDRSDKKRSQKASFSEQDFPYPFQSRSRSHEAPRHNLPLRLTDASAFFRQEEG